jgi:hypothetical protein
MSDEVKKEEEERTLRAVCLVRAIEYRVLRWWVVVVGG